METCSRPTDQSSAQAGLAAASGFGVGFEVRTDKHQPWGIKVWMRTHKGKSLATQRHGKDSQEPLRMKFPPVRYILAHHHLKPPASGPASDTKSMNKFGDSQWRHLTWNCCTHQGRAQEAEKGEVSIWCFPCVHSIQMISGKLHVCPREEMWNDCIKRMDLTLVTPHLELVSTTIFAIIRTLLPKWNLLRDPWPQSLEHGNSVSGCVSGMLRE